MNGSGLYYCWMICWEEGLKTTRYMDRSVNFLVRGSKRSVTIRFNIVELGDV